MRAATSGCLFVAVLAWGLEAGARPPRLPMFEPLFTPFVVEDPTQPRIMGPIDTRFFGTFCQPTPKTFCKSVPVLPDPCVTLSETRIHLDHITTPLGGQLSGGGEFRLDGDGGGVTIAGRTVGRVRFLSYEVSAARLVATAPGIGTMQGYGYLSPDGLSLSARLQGRTLVLRKDACGNNPPIVGVSALSGPSFPYGQMVHLLGSVQDEDSSFPLERLVYRSNIQGVLQGWRSGGGRNLSLSTLTPGPHRITFTVTDSGGLSRSDFVDVNILDRPPGTPVIFLPVEGATLVAGAPFLLQGTAFDPDSGRLYGSALRWTAQLVPGGPHVPLGSGTELATQLAQPASPVRIRLTATDSNGHSAFVERTVTVALAGQNSPPVVVIRDPDRTLVDGSPVAGLYSFEPASFVGTAFDAEDPPADLQVVWEVVAISGPGGPPLATPPVPNPAPIVGTLAPVVHFHPQAEGLYRVILRVTDRGGVTSADSIEVWTQRNPIG